MKNRRLKDLRKKNKLTQRALAERTGLSQSMIAHIEAGRKEPSRTYKMSLAKFFGVTVEWLFYEQINDFESLKRCERIS